MKSFSIKHRVAVAALSAAATSPVLAEKSIDEEIITIATRTPELQSNSLSTTTVITSSDIDRLQAKDIFELLSNVPGVSFVRNGGKGSSTSLLLRGNQGDHTLVLIDGIRSGSATLGSANLAALSANLIDRVEIINGPKSALYGADAIGGVVNIITRKSSKPTDFVLETGIGSNNTKETTFLAGLSNGDHSLTVVGNSFQTDGIDHTSGTTRLADDEDAYRNNSLGVNYQFDVNDSLTFKAIYNANDGENEYDSNCTNATTFAPVDCLIYAKSFVETISAQLAYRPSESFTTSLQVGQSKDESENLADNVSLINTFNGGEFNTRKREVIWLNHLTVVEGQVVTVGADYQLDEVEGTTDYDEDSRYNRAGFIQLQSGFGRFDTVIGVRNDDNEQFGSHTTYSALAGYSLNDELRLTASYGEGFKAPTFNDLYFPFFGNPTFIPEESKNYELGLKGEYENLSFYVAAYKNDIKNLIQFNPAIFASDQTAEAEITGLELNVDTEINDWIIGLKASVIDPENKVNGQLLRRRAERTVTVNADRYFGNFSFGFSIRGESERYDDVANTRRLGGYGTVDLRAQYQINDEWKVKAKVTNVADKEYATAIDFSLGEYRAIGREAFISVVYTPSL